MKVLFLGYKDSPLIEWLKENGETVIATDEKLLVNDVDALSPDFIISYGYRYIIPKDIIDKFRDRIINLHISYLPWNRGADPNFWSFVENTPKGVTIHYMDEGLDTGDIIVQQEIKFDSNETLRTSYQKLHTVIQSLFKQYWNSIKNRTCPRVKQTEEGTHHFAKDKEKLKFLLVYGWDTPVKVLMEYAQKNINDYGR